MESEKALPPLIPIERYLTKCAIPPFVLGAHQPRGLQRKYCALIGQVGETLNKNLESFSEYLIKNNDDPYVHNEENKKYLICMQHLMGNIHQQLIVLRKLLHLDNNPLHPFDEEILENLNKVVEDNGRYLQELGLLRETINCIRLPVIPRDDINDFLAKQKKLVTEHIQKISRNFCVISSGIQNFFENSKKEPLWYVKELNKIIELTNELKKKVESKKDFPLDKSKKQECKGIVEEIKVYLPTVFCKIESCLMSEAERMCMQERQREILIELDMDCLTSSHQIKSACDKSIKIFKETEECISSIHKGKYKIIPSYLDISAHKKLQDVLEKLMKKQQALTEEEIALQYAPPPKKGLFDFQFLSDLKEAGNIEPLKIWLKENCIWIGVEGFQIMRQLGEVASALEHEKKSGSLPLEHQQATLKNVNDLLISEVIADDLKQSLQGIHNYFATPPSFFGLLRKKLELLKNKLISKFTPRVFEKLERSMNQTYERFTDKGTALLCSLSKLLGNLGEIGYKEFEQLERNELIAQDFIALHNTLAFQDQEYFHKFLELNIQELTPSKLFQGFIIFSSLVKVPNHPASISQFAWLDSIFQEVAEGPLKNYWLNNVTTLARFLNKVEQGAIKSLYSSTQHNNENLKKDWLSYKAFIENHFNPLMLNKFIENEVKNYDHKYIRAWSAGEESYFRWQDLLQASKPYIARPLGQSPLIGRAPDDYFAIRQTDLEKEIEAIQQQFSQRSSLFDHLKYYLGLSSLRKEIKEKSAELANIRISREKGESPHLFHGKVSVIKENLKKYKDQFAAHESNGYIDKAQKYLLQRNIRSLEASLNHYKKSLREAAHSYHAARKAKLHLEQCKYVDAKLQEYKNNNNQEVIL
jgi:hypothetical protein